MWRVSGGAEPGSSIITSVHVPPTKMSHMIPPPCQGNVSHGGRGKHRCGWSTNSLCHKSLCLFEYKIFSLVPMEDPLYEPPARPSHLWVISPVGPPDHTRPDTGLLFFQVEESGPFRLIQQNLSIYFLST